MISATIKKARAASRPYRAIAKFGLPLLVIAIARALAARPKLLVLEDPTAGIDIGAKQDLYQTIRSHRSEGMSFLWMSSDLTETLTLCDRVYAMYDGRIVSEIAAPTMADEEHLLAAVLGRGGTASRP